MFGAKEVGFWQQKMVVGQKMRRLQRLQRVPLAKRSPSDRTCNWQHHNAPHRSASRARKPIDKIHRLPSSTTAQWRAAAGQRHLVQDRFIFPPPRLCCDWEGSGQVRASRHCDILQLRIHGPVLHASVRIFVRVGFSSDVHGSASHAGKLQLPKDHVSAVGASGWDVSERHDVQ